MTSFNDLKINEEIKKALENANFIEMTQVQSSVIPEFIKRDVIVQSQTGSGKTLSYLIPILNALYLRNSEANYILGLVIVPTRELSIQILEILKIFKFKSEIFIGGSKIEEDVEKLKTGLSIAIGTPGRLLEIISGNSKAFSKLKYVILDESDKLLSFGFEAKLQRILDFLPKNRFTGLFSATINESINKLSQSFLKNPVLIKVTEQIPDKLNLKYLMVSSRDKIDALAELMLNKKSIVFFSTCNSTDYFFELFSKIFAKANEITDKIVKDETIADKDETTAIADKDAHVTDKTTANQVDAVVDKDELTDIPIENADKVVQDHQSFTTIFNNFAIHKIHGKMDQRDRNQIYSGFEKIGGALFCTDVAARGIDFKEVDLVIHFDVPKDHENIVHRSGRTARNGHEGESIVFLMPNEKSMIDFLKLKGLLIERTELPSKAKSEESNSKFYEIGKSIMNKEILNLSVRAFVSYVRGYKEHILNYILNYKELNFDDLADLHYLVKIPMMTELKNLKFKNYEKPEQEPKPKRRRQK